MRKLFLTILTIYALSLAAIWFGRFALIYPFNPAHITPINAGVPKISEHVFNSFDETPLIVWTKLPNGRKPTIVYFHGNAGNLAVRAQRFNRLVNRGYGLLAMAYRGSSGSKGKPSQSTIMQDAIYLVENKTKLGFSSKSPLIYYGESLGTGVAVQLANTQPPKAIVLEAPYKSITDLAAAQMPFFPIRYILDQRWNTLNAIKTVKVPLLVIHGQQDKLIPVAHGKAVFSASPSPQKTLKVIETGHHEDLWSIEGQRAIFSFISKF